MKSYKRQMDLNSYLLEQDFEDYCRYAYEKIQSACDFLGIINDEDFESFKERCYSELEANYLNSVEKTIL